MTPSIPVPMLSGKGAGPAIAIAAVLIALIIVAKQQPPILTKNGI